MKTRTTISAAAKAVTRLVTTCSKGGPLYDQSPRAVAHVSRTSKWLLNAITSLNRELDAVAAKEDAHAQ